MEEQSASARGGVARAAAIIALGNIVSRVLGLARESVIAYLFGASGAVSIFRVASTIIQSLYDFLVGGMVSAALVPIFSDYATRADKRELWRVASIVINSLALLLALAVLVLELFAPQLILILGGGYDAALQSSAVEMIRLILPAVFFLGMSGVITGLLYSLKRFAYPAFTTAAYNLGIVVIALALTPLFGITSLVIGIIIGAALQVLLQLPGLRGMQYHWTIDFTHPALLTILKLYLPVLAGLTISIIGVFIDRNLASFTGAQSLAWMQDATVLVQLPLGLVGTAISFAILPTLSNQLSVASGQIADNRSQTADGISNFQPPTSNLQPPTSNFQDVLAFGIKLVLLIILPATIGLFILARPIVALLFERGAFTAFDTAQTARALQFYLIGLPFAAIDQPLVFAFYARKQTLAPNLVAFAGVAVYVVVALTLIQPLGFIGLVIANAAQLTSHALVMLWLTQSRLGGLGKQGIGILLMKITPACAAMSIVAWFSADELTRVGANIFVAALAPMVAASVVYLALLRVLRVREAEQVGAMISARLKGIVPA
ncbi:MAG: murein biosynthesis integral membrane protein MurJ [Chloroflexi bacterium]|nr:murein biosynthesis integral membrane protein MurJ [Chloroflexota bacterium]